MNVKPSPLFQELFYSCPWFCFCSWRRRRRRLVWSGLSSQSILSVCTPSALGWGW
ncbi:hypothetical protein DL95DRAFT_4555 [Leptodontidium sp. 2 PMI_412]|nr:hypothetical protein DL95DRAFT_4555 [Leptodontidium sp. 2 PMI_412]